MRTLKFRVWDKDTAKCVDGVGELYISILEFGTKTFYLEQMCPGRYIVEQYTGLKDKNGKEICEGDIIEVIGADVAQVVASPSGEWKLYYKLDPDETKNGFACVAPKNKPSGLWKTNTTSHIKIIGNIHENKELLGGEE